MTKFETYLVSIGYKRYRKVYRKKLWGYIEDSDGYYFSTMVTGMLDYRYVLNQNFDKEIVFGLNELYKPPTLCSPRPAGVFTDDEMNRLLSTESPEDIYKMVAR